MIMIGIQQWMHKPLIEFIGFNLKLELDKINKFLFIGKINNSILASSSSRTVFALCLKAAFFKAGYPAFLFAGYLAAISGIRTDTMFKNKPNNLAGYLGYLTKIIEMSRVPYRLIYLPMINLHLQFCLLYL